MLSVDVDRFVALCLRLIELGATRVEAGGFVALFPQRQGQTLATAARHEPPPSDAQLERVLSPEEQLERELQLEKASMFS